MHDSELGSVRIVGVQETDRVRMPSRLLVLPSGHAHIDTPVHDERAVRDLLPSVEGLSRRAGARSLAVLCIEDAVAGVLADRGYVSVGDVVFRTGAISPRAGDPSPGLQLERADPVASADFGRVFLAGFAASADDATRAQAGQLLEETKLLDRTYPDTRASWIVRYNGETAGVLCLDFADASIEVLGVLPDAQRGDGIVDALAGESLDRLARAGHGVAHASAAASNTPSNKLQERFGLHVDASFTRYRLDLDA